MKAILKRVYDGIPLKKYLFLILRQLSLPEYIFKHLHFTGLLTVKIKDKSFRIYHYGYQLENEIFWKGIHEGWEKTSIRIWIELSRKSTTILDIGANTGIFSLVSKAVNPESKVFAFEPVQRVFEKLKKNVAINLFDVISERKGISNFEGKATIFDLPDDHIYSVTVNENTNPPDRDVIPTEIDVITLDQYFKDAAIDKIDLMKIDVETHEPAVLEGALGVLRRSRPALIIEILNDQVAGQVNTILEEFDYLYFALNENTGPKRCAEIKPHEFGNYLICTKADAAFLKLDHETA